MRRIAVINQKGGVGKTTTTANLGAALAEQGRRVVLVDMDAQANLSLSLGVEAESGSPTSYTVLVGDTSFESALRPTAVPNLSLVPSNIDLSGAELELASQFGREFLLRDALKAWEEEHRKEHGRAPADYLLFDCPPSLGLLAVNALAASGEVLITLQTEFLALQGMSKLVEVVQLLRRRLNPELVISGILPCLYESRVRLAREVLGEIKQYFPGQVFPVPIRNNVKLAEAPSFGQTILQYAPDSIGATDYRCAAREVLRNEARDPELAGLSPFDERVLAGIHRTEVPRAAAAKPAPIATTPPPAATSKPAPVVPSSTPAPAAPAATRAAAVAAPSSVPAKSTPLGATTTSAPEPAAKAPKKTSSRGATPAQAAAQPAPHPASASPTIVPAAKKHADTARSPTTKEPVAKPAPIKSLEHETKKHTDTARSPAAKEPSAKPTPIAKLEDDPKAKATPRVNVDAPAARPKANGPTLTPITRPEDTIVPAARPVAKLEREERRTPDAPRKLAPAPTPTPPKRERAASPKVARKSSLRADEHQRVLRAEDLPPLPPDAFEILSNFGLDP